MNKVSRSIISGSRLVLILALFLVFTMLSFSAGCGGSKKPAPAGESTGPTKGGTFTLAITDDPPMWPVAGGIYNILVNKVLYDTLVKYDPKDLHPVGGLAESWEVSPDGLVWTFKLRQGVKWHDGKPFTADDVAFTFKVWMNPKVPFYLRGNVSAVDSVEVVDPHTVKVHMKQPVASFPVLLGYNMGILPAHLLSGLTDEQLAKPTEFLAHPVGTGPFKFAEKQSGAFVKLVANPDYWDGAPYLDAVVFKIVPDIDAQVAQARAGDLDLVVIEPHQRQAVEGASNLHIDEAPQVNHVYIDLNNTLPVFKEKAVRQALTYGLDRKSIVEKLLGGSAQIATGPISPIMDWAYNPNVKQYPYDPDKANQLLDEAGWKRGADGIRVKNGVRLSFQIEVDPNPTRQQIALIAKDNWAKLGVETKIETLEYNVILQRARSKPPTHQANPNWLITPPDPDLTTYYATGAGGNTAEYSNPEVDELLRQGRATSDREARARIYKRMQEIIAEDAPIIYLYYPREIRVLNNRVQGFAPVGYRDALTYAHKIWIKK